MMKTKIKKKNYLKIGVLLFLSSLLLINCNNEMEPEVNEKKPNFSFKKISFKTLKKESKKTARSLNMIAKYNSNYFNLKNNDSSTYYIDSTNIVNLSDNNGFTSYTFSVISDLDKPSLQNIIISNYADGTTNTVLVEYTLDKILGEILNTIEDNIIEKKCYQLDNPILTNTNKSSGFNSSCVEIGYYLTRTRNKCEPTDNNPNCIDENGSMIRITTTRFITVAEFCEDGGTSGNFINNNNNNNTYPDSWINGGGANGNNSTIPSNIIATSPTNSNSYIKSFLKTNNFLINSPEYLWIEDNPFLADTFGQAITTFPNNPETTINILHYLMQNDTLPYGGINFQETFDFVDDNDNSEETQEFVAILIDVILNNPNNINFNELITSPIINNLNLSECNRKLISNAFLTKKFLKNNSFGNKMFNSFIENTTRHLFIESNSNLPISIVAKTNFVRTVPFISTLTGEQVNIQFNPTFLNQASDIAVVTYLFHEFLHAYIINLYHEGSLLSTYPQYISLNDACDTYKNDSNYPNVDPNGTIALNLQNEMHDIYVDFIDDLANAVRDYAIQNNIKINNEIISLDYARNLVWGSLSSENVFSNNLTVTERQQANDIMRNETQNNNESTPKKTCHE